MYCFFLSMPSSNRLFAVSLHKRGVCRSLTLKSVVRLIFQWLVRGPQMCYFTSALWMSVHISSEIWISAVSFSSLQASVYLYEPDSEGRMGGQLLFLMPQSFLYTATSGMIFCCSGNLSQQRTSRTCCRSAPCIISHNTSHTLTKLLFRTR